MMFISQRTPGAKAPPMPNFTLLDMNRPDVASLVAAMIRAHLLPRPNIGIWRYN